MSRESDGIAIKGKHSCGQIITMIVKPNEEQEFMCNTCMRTLSILFTEKNDHKTLDIKGANGSFELYKTDRVPFSSMGIA
jgi:hypothetical protein